MLNKLLRFLFFLLVFQLIFLKFVQANDSVKTIILREDQFEPDTLTIKLDSKVIFKNEGNSAHWPASDLHPTHLLYPEFDPKKPIFPGQSWEFTATKAGRWGFHDHLSPHIKGTLIVEGELPLSYLDSLKKALSDLFSKISLKWFHNQPQGVSVQNFLAMDQATQIKNIRQMADFQGAQKAWSFINSAYADNSPSAHDLAHLVGELIYDQKGFTGLNICTVKFAFGCYHGFLDKAFLNGTADLKKAEQACLNLGRIDSGPYGSCIHGIGHGLASYHQTKNLEDALVECNRLSAGQQFCYDGVFMEFERSAIQSFYKNDDPLYPCDQISQLYLVACGRNQVRVMLDRLGLQFAQVADICANADAEGFKNACFDSLGFYAVTVSGGNPKLIISQCLQIKIIDYQSRCLISAAGELVFQDTPGWQTSAPKTCDGLEGQPRDDCYQNYQRIAHDYGRN